MSQQARALLIGLFGPALQAVGVTWDLLEHAIFERSEIGHLTLTHVLTGPAHLVVFTGFALSVICIPIALELAVAGARELQRPPLEDDDRDRVLSGTLETLEAGE